MVSVLLVLAQLLAPTAAALMLPRWLLGAPLEAHVVAGLAPVVAATAALQLLSSALLFRDNNNASSVVLSLAHGLAGIAGGAALWHVVLCLFGAPLDALVLQTFLLALLLSSLTTAPAAICLGQRLHVWVDVLVNLRVRSAEEVYLAGSAIGAALGAYVGALPIPLDWDRPWQQWPLTCVYGALGGHALGVVVGAVAALRWETQHASARRAKAE